MKAYLKDYTNLTDLNKFEGIFVSLMNSSQRIFILSEFHYKYIMYTQNEAGTELFIFICVYKLN